MEGLDVGLYTCQCSSHRNKGAGEWQWALRLFTQTDPGYSLAWAVDTKMNLRAPMRRAPCAGDRSECAVCAARQTRATGTCLRQLGRGVDALGIKLVLLAMRRLKRSINDNVPGSPASRVGCVSSTSSLYAQIRPASSLQLTHQTRVPNIHRR